MKRLMTLRAFRRLLHEIAQKQLKEFVANTDGDPHKDGHADPTAKAWDAGLDEEHVELEPVDADSGFENFECNACGYRCPGYEHGDYRIEGTCPRCGHDNTADDDPNEIKGSGDVQQFQESDEDHEDDPRWDDHADPTGKEWHAGLDSKG